MLGFSDERAPTPFILLANGNSSSRAFATRYLTQEQFRHRALKLWFAKFYARQV